MAIRVVKPNATIQTFPDYFQSLISMRNKNETKTTDTAPPTNCTETRKQIFSEKAPT